MIATHSILSSLYEGLFGHNVEDVRDILGRAAVVAYTHKDPRPLLKQARERASSLDAPWKATLITLLDRVDAIASGATNEPPVGVLVDAVSFERAMDDRRALMKKGNA